MGVWKFGTRDRNRFQASPPHLLMMHRVAVDVGGMGIWGVGVVVVGAVAFPYDRVGFLASSLHLLKKLRGLVWLLILLECADERVVFQVGFPWE